MLNILSFLIGLCALAMFFWAQRNRQFDDPAGSAARILLDDDLGSDGAK